MQIQSRTLHLFITPYLVQLKSFSEPSNISMERIMQLTDIFKLSLIQSLMGLSEKSYAAKNKLSVIFSSK